MYAYLATFCCTRSLYSIYQLKQLDKQATATKAKATLKIIMAIIVFLLIAQANPIGTFQNIMVVMTAIFEALVVALVVSGWHKLPEPVEVTEEQILLAIFIECLFFIFMALSALL